MMTNAPDADALREEHTSAAIARRLANGPRGRYLRDFVFGAIDGIVTTFAVAAGAVGGRLGATVVVVLGVANLVADGFSMAASNFLGYRAEAEQRARIQREEQQHVDLAPEGEREEVRQILAAKGFRGEELEHAVDLVTSRRDWWIETMVREEHGFGDEPHGPARSALVTFAAFVVAGTIPLVPFLADSLAGVSVSTPFLWSSMCAAIGFVLVGALKSRFIDRAWWQAGVETLAVGGVAAALAYGAGVLLANFV